MEMQVSGYLLLSIAVFLYGINVLFVSSKGNIKLKDPEMFDRETPKNATG